MCLAATAIYLYQNDFAPETIDVLYPAVGAALLSAFLGFKLIWLDKPKPLEFSTTIAVMMDPDTVRYTALGSGAGRFPGEFSGLWILEGLPHDSEIQDVMSQRSADKPLLRDVVEYGLVRWLKEQKQWVGYVPGPTLRLVNGSGASGKFSVELAPVTVEADANVLLRAHPITLALPAGSTARLVTSNALRQIILTTPHTTATFAIVGGAMERLDRLKGASRATRLFDRFGMQAGNYLHAFRIDGRVEQGAWTRFSEQARVEEQWSRAIAQQFDEDFSWNRLSAALIEEP